MKIEIESAENGYIVTTHTRNYDLHDKPYSLDSTFVIECTDTDNESLDEQQTFHQLTQLVQDLFGVYNSKHNLTGFVSGVCSEHIRYDLTEQMKESLTNPQNDLGD